MKIAFGSDHAGYRLKKTVMEHLAAQGHLCEDCGTDTDETPASYVPAAVQVAGKVNRKEADFGVLVCGTGLGISTGSGPLFAPMNIWHAWPDSTMTRTFSRWARALSGRESPVRSQTPFSAKPSKPADAIRFV